MILNIILDQRLNLIYYFQTVMEKTKQYINIVASNLVWYYTVWPSLPIYCTFICVYSYLPNNYLKSLPDSSLDL